MRSAKREMAGRMFISGMLCAVGITGLFTDDSLPQKLTDIWLIVIAVMIGFTMSQDDKIKASQKNIIAIQDRRIKATDQALKAYQDMLERRTRWIEN